MSAVQPVTLGDLVTAIGQNTQTLQALAAAIQAQNAAQATLNIAPQAPVPVTLSPSLPLPLSPATLVQAVVASQSFGVAQFLFLRYATTVASLASGQVLYPVPPGYVLLIIGKFTLKSDLHDPNLTATVVVDGTDVLYDAYPISADDAQDLPQFGVIRRSLEATYLNGTSSPAVVTATAGTVLLQASVYDGVILPLLKLGNRTLELFAENQQALIPAG